jgi:hypothetical protein
LPSAVNTKWQKLLAGVPGVENSPWQYYRLNAVQWFDGPELFPKNHDGIAISRNSVLETYLLGDQTIASQIPAVGPINAGPTVFPPNSTLADTIVATIVAGYPNANDPKKGTGPNTWSSCVLCHQMALYQWGTDKVHDVVMTDYSFVFRSYLPPGGAPQKKNGQLEASLIRDTCKRAACAQKVTAEGMRLTSNSTPRCVVGLNGVLEHGNRRPRCALRPHAKARRRYPYM